MPDLSDFNPVFGTRLDAFKAELDKEGIGYTQASGYRSPEYQNRMYQNHLAKQAGQALPFPNDEAPDVVAKPWNSFHNYGIATDFTLKNDADYARLQALAPQYGLSGIGMSDKGHIQLAGSLADNVSKYKLAGWRPASQPAPATGALAYSGPAGVLAEQGPENAGGGAPVASSSGPQDPRQIVYNKLIAAGLQPHQALGALWSLGGEGGAGLDPRSYNAKDPGGSIGYGQWNQTRRTALEGLAQANGTSWADPNTQADHIVNELTNKDYASYQPGVLTALQAAKTPEEAAQIWTGKYERPLKDNSDQRIKGGAQVATLDKNNNLVLGTATGGGPAPTPAVASNAAPATAKPDDRSWLDKLIGSPVDAQGNPTGAKSPLQELSQASVARLGSEGQTERQEEPERSALSMQGPAVHVPTAPSQAYGMTLNSFSTPLTWTSKAGALPGLTQAGLQGGLAPVPGLSLNSLPPSSQGLGYGVNDVGYGFG